MLYICLHTKTCIFLQIIDSFLWLMCQNKNDILAADTTLGEVVKHGSSTRQLWQGMQFGDIESFYSIEYQRCALDLVCKLCATLL